MRDDQVFEAALVAVGPPLKMPPLSDFEADAAFCAHVQEYNAFITTAGIPLMPWISYVEFYKWFAKKVRRKD